MVAHKVWDESAVDEWANVRKNDKDASVGRIFSIMGEKHAERRLPEADKEYKARIVFAGNNIQTASGVAPHELFQEVSSAPAAMASVRATLAVGALRGWRPMMRDAAQAYIQASIRSWSWETGYFGSASAIHVAARVAHQGRQARLRTPTRWCRCSKRFTDTQNPAPCGKSTWPPSSLS